MTGSRQVDILVLIRNFSIVFRCFMTSWSVCSNHNTAQNCTWYPRVLRSAVMGGIIVKPNWLRCHKTPKWYAKISYYNQKCWICRSYQNKCSSNFPKYLKLITSLIISYSICLFVFHFSWFFSNSFSVSSELLLSAQF